MSVDVHIITGPLGAPAPWNYAGGGGALLQFEGMVRPVENRHEIAALDYEAYEPMASNLLRRLGEQMIREHGLIAMCVEHSVGRIGAGECSFRLRIAAWHRKEALAAADQFIDRMKRDVPIWKMAVSSSEFRVPG